MAKISYTLIKPNGKRIKNLKHNKPFKAKVVGVIQRKEGRIIMDEWLELIIEVDTVDRRRKS